MTPDFCVGKLWALGTCGLALSVAATKRNPDAAPTYQCDLDGLWSAEAATEIAAIKTGSGPTGSAFRSPQVCFNTDTSLPPPAVCVPATVWALPAFSTRSRGNQDVPAGYYAVAHAAIGCTMKVLGGCLKSTSHTCSTVTSGGFPQCVWIGEDTAASACTAWAECNGFWCGAASDVPNSNSSWCWARGNSDLIHGGDFQTATSFIKTSVPLAVEMKCTSVDCGWISAEGGWSRDTNNLSVTLDNGTTLTAVVKDNCSTIAWTTGQIWTNQMKLVKKVHVVYMAHFDVGYTSPNVQALLDVYATQYFPQVFNVSETMRMQFGDKPDLQYKWTSHPWLLLALLQNQTGSVPQGFPDQLEAAIRRGDVLYHANPMNMQGEAGELTNMDAGMSEAELLDEYFGQEKKVAASQKDEPGATLGMVSMFNRHGVRMLHIGANDFSTVPALPSISAAYHGFCNPFRWGDSELPNGTDLLTLYCSGYSGSYELGIEAPNMMAVIPGMDEALAYLMHVDNRGPQTVAQVLEGIAAVHRNFPNAEVVVSSMDAWARSVLASNSTLTESALPRVVDVEPGSTWVQGVASDPYKIRRYRAVARVAARAVAAGDVDPGDPRYTLFQDLLLKEPEHTWGASSGCEGDYTDKQFYDPKYSCTPGSAEYNMTVKSYVDQRTFIDRAVAALADLPLRNLCESELANSEPNPLSTTNLEPFNIQETVSLSGGIQIAFNKSGAILSLTRNGGRALAGPQNPLGLFSYVHCPDSIALTDYSHSANLRYAKHSGAVLDQWGATYGLENCAHSCGHCSFSKCGYPSSIEQAVTAATVTQAWYNATTGTFLFNVTFGSSGVLDSPLFGAPMHGYLKATVKATVNDASAIDIDHDLAWFEKPATRAAESLWFTVAPMGFPREGWTMDKLGRWVDPLSVPVNGSRTRHAVWSGVRHSDKQGGLDAEINTTDAPLVIVGPNTYDPNGAIGPSVSAHPEQGWAFNLFNNAWATNFPAFSIDAEQRFRFNTRLR